MEAEPDTERPPWIDEVLAEIKTPHKPHGDTGRQLREWLGLILAGVLVWFVVHGLYALSDIQARINWTASTQAEMENALDRHIESANAANLALSQILSRIDRRMSRLEGIEEGRSGNGG